MAYDYFISAKEDSDRLAIPEWIRERDDRMVSYISHGEVDYKGVFSKTEVIKLSSDYAEIWEGAMSDSYSRLHKRGIEYVNHSHQDEFTINAVYWSSGAY